MLIFRPPRVKRHGPSARRTQLLEGKAYIIYFAPILFNGVGAGDTRKSSEELFYYGVDGIYSRSASVQARLARRNVESDKVFDFHEVWSGDTGLEIL